ncbi:MAG: DUF1730 domain-containing protein [Clostridia bacterium]|nr:DUF1730 domain-containing protein [Clostridia bacterium]
MLKQEIRALLDAEHIECAGVIPFSACRVWQARKLSCFGLDESSAHSVLMLLVPYYAGAFPDLKISIYAVGRDYHDYFKGFFSRVCPALEKAFPGYRFGGSADNAPIDERHAALTAGLGILGDNGLLINETYGTYVFIGEIISDMPAEDWYESPDEVILHDEAHCEHCGACKRACPMNGNNPYGIKDCLSAVNQTKHLEDPDMLRYIRYYDAAWGCDRCQSSCPHNKSPKPSPIPYWQEDLLPYPTAKDVEAMPEDVFAARAYAWRKKATILRNLTMLEEDAAAGCITLDKAEAIMDAMREAGAVMRRAHDVESIADGIEEKPGSANFVTVYDVKVQNMLMERLNAILPDAKYFAEEKENDASLLDGGYCFIIDPIDGTTNFIHNYCGMSAISVGLFYCGTAVFGAIYDPYRDDMYSARKGLGAFLNGKRISVSDRPAEKAVYAVGTSPYYKDTLTERTFSMMKTLFLAGADIRRAGSAALDLAAVACGSLDGFAEMVLSPWDYAAGALLIEEAGGTCCQPDGQPLSYVHPCPIAAGTKNTMEILCRAANIQ